MNSFVFTETIPLHLSFHGENLFLPSLPISPPSSPDACLHADKAPYIVYVEVLEIENRHTSPVPPKLLESNTLRYTRSEENLPDYFSRMELNSGGNSSNGNGSGGGSSACGISVNSDQTSMTSAAKPDSFSVYSAPDVDDADCWSQEDDDIYISFQVRYCNLCCA